MTSRPRGSSVERVNSEPNSAPDRPDAAMQEAIDATAASYAGDSTIDVERNLRAELESRGVASVDDAWVDDVTERIRQGREVVVGEHDASVDAGEDLDG
jgi:hypothetical protein